MSRKISRILLHIALISIGIVWIFPFVWMVSASFKTNIELVNAGTNLIPEMFRVDNYIKAWTEANFQGYFLNTVVITVSTVFIVVAMSALTGYALGRVKFPGRNLFIILITATMFIPKGYTIIPVYMVIKSLGLLNTLGGVILAESGGAHVLFILLFMSYFMKMPKELEESATVDGCGFLRTFGSIMLPLAKPIIATAGIMQFIWTWNSFFVPLVFTINKPELRTLAVGMYSFVGENTTDWVGMAAGATISLIPVIIVFIAFQRFFIEGVTGSVKG
ncbi:carbohydrate ABC transporter permease [Litoribacterium kuwaitense]|uniref:carbohydrate ABC transporter permease n=1 Tax=Litoribacterium kuwaitense TaxID=1398745 RepID=UPI001FE3862F|nr:carbohydrate ABC transporter permease [Litoribacterium kuwaitense]